jgi:hypothetical protein
MTDLINWKEKDICPACAGTGEIEFDDGYDENGMLTSSYYVRCYRCPVNVGKYQQPLDVMLALGKDVYYTAEADNG